MTNYADESEQLQAYQATLEYLVASGTYGDVDEADRDASARVDFCEQIDFYANDEQLKNASIHEKKRQALIHANDLYDIIAENDGQLPCPNGPDTSSASEESDDHETDSEQYHLEPGASEQIVLEPAGEPAAESPDKALTGSEPGSTPHAEKNPFLRVILNLVMSAIVIAAILLSLTQLFNSEQQLQIIKYGSLLFTALTALFVTLSEVRDKIWMRLRNKVGHSLFVASASLSGLLFMQPQWNDDTFTVLNGVQGLIANPVIHDISIIGPYWPGIFFAAIALFVFIATHAAAMPQK